MIEVEDLKVDYGDNVAVDGLSFSAKQGEVYGLIGPNGAGKTTTIRAIATLLEPTYGEINVGGVSVLHEPEKARGLLGYMPDFPPVYDDLRVSEFVELFAAAYAVAPERRRSEVERCLQATDLTTHGNALCKTLSRGMKQRALLAKTLVHDPPALLLDEPAANLDPKARIDLRNLLRRLAKEGKTILISSHVLTELQDLCDSIGIMREGKMVVDGKLEEVVKSSKSSRYLRIELLEPHAGIEDFFNDRTNASPSEAIDEKSISIKLAFSGSDEEKVELLRDLVTQGASVKSFLEEKADVEDLFLAVEAGENPPSPSPQSANALPPPSP